MQRGHRVVLLVTIALLVTSSNALAFDVDFGVSWDAISLQSILDAEYGPGAIDVVNDYIGANPGDPDPMYWQDAGLDGLIIREVAGYANSNIMGWHEETLAGAVGGGVVFVGPMSQGASVSISFPAGLTTFGFWLNPNGAQSGINAPEPEKFYVNRAYNDLGPDGSGAIHLPFDGDPQCLVYDITHLRNGVPTFVLAWEDLDSGGEITPTYQAHGTDNDYQDLVVEITAISPVEAPDSSFGRVKALYAD